MTTELLTIFSNRKNTSSNKFRLVVFDDNGVQEERNGCSELNPLNLKSSMFRDNSKGKGFRNCWKTPSTKSIDYYNHTWKTKIKSPL